MYFSTLRSCTDVATRSNITSCYWWSRPTWMWEVGQLSDSHENCWHFVRTKDQWRSRWVHGAVYYRTPSEFRAPVPNCISDPKDAFYGAHATPHSWVSLYLWFTYLICCVFSCSFGPLIRHWTMRYEAKHSYFKKLSQCIGNFVNLPFSLALRHQQYQCYLSTTHEEDMITGPGIYLTDCVPMKYYNMLFICTVKQVSSSEVTGINESITEKIVYE